MGQCIAGSEDKNNEALFTEKEGQKLAEDGKQLLEDGLHTAEYCN